MLSQEAKVFCHILSKTLSREITWIVQHNNASVIEATGFTLQSKVRYYYTRHCPLNSHRITHCFMALTNGLKTEKIEFTSSISGEDAPNDLILFRLFTKWEEVVIAINNAKQFLIAIDPSFDK